MSQSNTNIALKKADALLREWEQERDFSGVAVIARGGVPEFEGCYGLANRADAIPICPKTRFGLASVTKMFTAVTVGSLVRRGCLSFDTPVVAILPSNRRPATLRADVTVHHLLSHTSGIADYFEEACGQSTDYASLWANKPSYRIVRPADFLPLFADLLPHRPPGQCFQYSNASYIMLGLIIEELAQAPYVDVVTAYVLEPAGLTDTGFFALDEVRQRVAIGYLRPREPGGLWRSNVYSIPSLGGPDGGAFSTAADLDKFLCVYANGSLLGDQLRDTLLTPRCMVREDVSMGYGAFLYGQGRFGHEGTDPGYEVIVQYIPQFDTSVIAMCNVNGFARQSGDLLVSTVLDTF